MSQRLQDRVAIVFGAGSSGPGWGNGKASAVAYAHAGARVVCVDMVEEAAAETSDIIRGESGDAISVAADATDNAAVSRVVNESIARYGRIDILHNNVGVVLHGGPTDLDEDQFRRNLDINLGSVFRTAKAVLPHFIAQKRGAIVNISSLAAIRWTGYPYFAYYAAKAAVNQATVALALQYAPHNVRANCIMPGMIDTPLIYKQIASQYASSEEMVAARAAAVPLGRMGTAWDVANAAVFLASDDAQFITGVALPVDGGQSCSVSLPR
ncbi:glucose 1-dehydrogenase [Terrarubrum flagellatum]|uniref:SDR family NAD(P)-dependent oxidoreductase n=1 Tax=Terrirubrum flagellatum TaxID=2895980 RepID=UPI003144FA7A